MNFPNDLHFSGVAFFPPSNLRKPPTVLSKAEVNRRKSVLKTKAWKTRDTKGCFILLGLLGICLKIKSSETNDLAHQLARKLWVCLALGLLAGRDTFLPNSPKALFVFPNAC